MNRRAGISLLLIPLVVLSSCKISKDVNKERTNYRNPEKVIDFTRSNNLKYSTATMKANITLSDEARKLSFKASLRVKKDSVLWSSMTLLGIAGARTLITNDSIKVVNYKENNFIVEDYTVLQEYLNTDILTLSNFQNLILGDWIELSEVAKYRLKIDDDNYYVSTLSERRIEKDWYEKKLEKLEKKKEKKEEKDSEKGLERLEKKQEKRPRKYEGLALEIMIDSYDLKTKSLRIKDYYFDGELRAEYSKFEKVGESLFPHKVVLEIAGKKKMKVEIEYYRISLDEDISMPFSIPKKYERVRL